MTTLLEIRNAHKRYGSRVLLDGASATIGDRHKVGLVGRNGAGKSTLCRILLGEEELDAGELLRHPRLRLGYLQQHDTHEPGETVLHFLQRQSGQPEWRCAEVAARFSIDQHKIEQPFETLSGGWQTRVKLAALLLTDPNLLVLDEPTNFLDLRTQMLLESFLQGFRGGCLIVSHDRGFLKATCTHTLELSRGRLTLFPGDIESFVAHQNERRLHDERVNASIQAKRRQLEAFIARNRANANTASQARSKAKQLARLETKELDLPEPPPVIRVPDVQPRRGAALRCLDLTIGYGQHAVATGIRLDVEHGSRVAVVGDNGQGKTTFLRSITGSLEPLSGQVRWGPGCEVGVYAQHVYRSLPDRWTVEEYLTDCAAPGVGTQTILDVAGGFLFRGDEVQKPIRVLSGGERARLCLAGLLLGRHNVLVLDEPVNHLDVETIDALSDALLDYRGTLLFTSHDRHFVRRVATAVIEVSDGRVASYPDNYEHYLYRVARETSTEQTDRTVAPSGRPTKANRQPRRRGNQSTSPHNGKTRGGSNRKHQANNTDGPKGNSPNKQRHQWRKEMASIERQVARLDRQKREIQERLLATTDAEEAQQLHTQLSELREQLDTMEQRWFALNEQIESV